MHSLFDLSQERVVQLYKYPKVFYGMIFDEEYSPIKYIFSLIIFYIFFSASVSVCVLLSYGHYSGAIDYGLLKDNLFLSLFNFGNIFSLILLKTHIPILIFLFLMTIYLFVNYIRFHKSNINKFHVNTHYVMLLVLLITWVQLFLLSLAIQPRVAILTPILITVTVLASIYKVYVGYVSYNSKIHDEENYKNSKSYEKIIHKALLITPFLIFIRQILIAGSHDGLDVKDFEGFVVFILLLLFPYIMALCGNLLTEKFLDSFLKHYYFAKYPEGFRYQIGKSVEDFYGKNYK